MNVVYRFRIYPNKIQQELFAKTFGCVRFVYNRMLAEKKECYEKTGKNLRKKYYYNLWLRNACGRF